MEADPPESSSNGVEDHHWLMVRGTCSVCSYTVSSDSFRTINEKNRDEINKYFSTNIENGTICLTCYNEYARWRKESGREEEEEPEQTLSFPFCYGVNAKESTYDLSSHLSEDAESTETEDSDNETSVVPVDPQTIDSTAFMGVDSADAQLINSLLPKKEATIAPSSVHLPSIPPQPIAPAPLPSVPTPIIPTSASGTPPLAKIKKKPPVGIARSVAQPKERLTPLTLSATSATSDLGYLSTLKVSELQEQLKKYNASTKGSKAQLIQRLVRYICLFNTNRPLPNDMSYLNILRVPQLNLAPYSAADLEMVTAVAAAAAAAAEQEASAKAEALKGIPIGYPPASSAANAFTPNESTTN